MKIFIHSMSEYAWGWPTMILFMLVGIVFTFRLRGIQIRKLPQALRSIHTDHDGCGMSSYTTLCTALAATIGTGNIVGVATALAAGGPGALFWMILSALFGMATQFAEGYLAVSYRKTNSIRTSCGPSSYMEFGLRKPWLGKLYASITVGAGLLGVGTITQINSISNALDRLILSREFLNGYSYTTIISGLIVTLIAALVLLGGARRISKVCETLVPLMSILYLFCSFLLLIRNFSSIQSAVGLIIQGAFCPKAVWGGFAGVGMKAVLRMGISRGVFTNEAGMGTAAITAGAASETDPFRQGLVSMSTTFIDTVVICTITGMCLIVTDAWKLPVEGGAITEQAWRAGLPWSPDLSSFLLTICLVSFAFATIIGWSFYAERCLIYLTNGKGIKLYRAAYLLALAVGPYLSVSSVFELADILNATMALPNMISLIFLQNRVVEGVRNNS